MKSHYTHIFFDLDGTLWDFRTNAIRSLRKIFDANQLQRYFATFEAFHQLYAPCNHALWDAYAQGKVTKDFLIIERFHQPLRTIGVDDIALAQQLSNDFFDTLTQQDTLMPFAREVLEHLHHQSTLSILSNGFPEVQYHKMRRSDIDKYFTHIVLSEEIGTPKPQPQFFEKALTLANAQATEVLMIGDEYNTDIIGAAAVNIDTIWYNPHHKTIDIAPLHNCEINSLNELITLLH